MPHFDIHLCAYNAELRLVADFMMSWLYTDEQHPTGLNRNIDIEAVAAEYDDRIEATRTQWFELLAETDQTVALCVVYCLRALRVLIVCVETDSVRVCLSWDIALRVLLSSRTGSSMRGVRGTAELVKRL